MRHYEVVILVHPDQSDQVPGMLERYRTLIEKSNGTIHRQEDWGRRQLSYPIHKAHKAHYLLMNIEVDAETLQELEGVFRFNDAVLRNMIFKRKKAVTEQSKIYEEELREKERERDREKRREEELAAKAKARVEDVRAAEDGADGAAVADSDGLSKPEAPEAQEAPEAPEAPEASEAVAAESFDGSQDNSDVEGSSDDDSREDS